VPINAIIRRLRDTAGAWKPTAVTVATEEKHTPFRVLIACILSLRTQDTTTGPAAERLFALADTPDAMLQLTPGTIERAIYPVGFYRTKTRVILDICRDLMARFGGRVPDDIDELLTLKGVGRKTANLVVTIGYAKPGICVDTHVHRISNRFGYVKTKTPEQTEIALRQRLPERHWIGYNDLLVTFGQNVCTPLSPKCSLCPVRALCRRVGVTRAR
jgi:endonuclease-3